MTAASTSSNDSGGTGSSSGGGGISPGAAAGIGLGSAAGALLLAGAFVFVFALGRRRHLADNPSATYSLHKKSNFPINTNIAASELSALAVPMPEMPGHPA